ncbi:MAG: thymidylate synthase [Burkholderiaceae bacterium]|nr:thymidylate synthase [Burkholderiaceae bacterium]
MDDLLAKAFSRLLASRNAISPTKGPAHEIAGVLLSLNGPRFRLSRTDNRGILFSCLGEWLWYLSGHNRLDFIKYYLPHYKDLTDDGTTIHGGYGPRLFGPRQAGQIKRVISLLKKKPDSRQAVVQIFRGDDLIGNHKDVPCTCTLQFMIRSKRLHLLTTMRSNDAYIGLPHDVFAFTMLQELVARSVDVELGLYKHFVGSFHLYDKNRDKAAQYLEEGYQARIPMPPMPEGDPWLQIEKVLQFEAHIRNGRAAGIKLEGLPDYWADLVRILQIFRLTKQQAIAKDVRALAARMSTNTFAPYIRKRIEKRRTSKRQLEIFDSLRA